jgi:hypothetical protein
MVIKKRYIRGTKLKAPMYSIVLREALGVKREPPAKPRPGRRPREYDLIRLDKGRTKVGGLWELGLFPFEGLTTLAERLEERARAEREGG